MYCVCSLVLDESRFMSHIQLSQIEVAHTHATRLVREGFPKNFDNANEMNLLLLL